jgi:hypothetical protein
VGGDQQPSDYQKSTQCPKHRRSYVVSPPIREPSEEQERATDQEPKSATFR